MNYKYTYETLTNDNVKFLQGTQSALNLYMPSSSDAEKRGAAEEGAFYLTTDTHRLYIGRKVTTGTDANKVFPEEISSGIVTVAETGELGNAASMAHDGDFYYVKDSNILAVYEATYDENGNITGGSWQQINAPTGIASITNTTTVSNKIATVNAAIASSGSATTNDAKFRVEAGNNLTITKLAASGSAPEGFKLDATDTTYAIAADTSDSKARIGLKKNGGSTLDSSVIINGGNTVAVTQANGQITVNGPSFAGITSSSTGTGFKAGLSYTDGGGTAHDTLTDNSGAAAASWDPTITYGTSSTIVTGTNESTSTVHYSNGNATLDVYTREQTDRKITKEVNDKIRTANAMTYVGILDSTHPLPSEVHNGDTFKVAGDSFNLGTSGTAKKGDLVIVSGTENASGVVTSPTYNIIPAGDEPAPTANLTAATSANSVTATSIAVTDGAENSTTYGDNIVTTNITKAGNKITVTSEIPNANDPTINIRVDHNTTSLDKTAQAIASAATSDSDTIGTTNPLTFYALKDLTDSTIDTDDYGHLTTFKASKIVIKHNGIDTVGTTYSASGNTATATMTMTDKFNIDKAGTVKVTSETLNVDSSAADGMKLELKWGSF